jgi:hypothetical protein
VASPVAARAATVRAPATTVAARWPPGGKTAVRVQPAANRHRDARSWIWASSAVMAAPQSRRSAGRVAVATASSRAGPSSPETLAPACRHQ